MLLLLALLLAPSDALAQDAPAAPAPPAEEPPPLVKAPELVEFVQAPFPPEAQAAGVEGSVLLLIEIDATGAVTKVEALDPIGYGFDEAAMEAAWKFRFSPAEDATGPVPVAIEFEYGFVLDSASKEGAVPEAAPAEVAELPVNLDGVLLEMGTRRPLADFPVRIDALGVEVKTDAEGRFAFRGVPLGAVELSSVYTGYDRATQKVDVVEGQVTSVRLWIKNQSYRDDELIAVYRKETADVTRRTISVQEIRRIPGTFGDPVRVVQSLPGAARTPFGTGLLVIRGANPEDSAVYIDGIRVPLIYHLGGYRSVISPDIIEGVDYLPGGYGVEYGRTLGGVVDVRTKDEYPEQNRFAWNTNLLDSGGIVEGRAGKDDGLGYAVAGRRSYIDVFIPYFTKDAEFTVKPRWFDYQVKLQDLRRDQGELSAFVFGFEDLLIASTPGTTQGTDQDAQGDLGTRYSTHRAIVEWQRPLTERMDLRIVPSVGLDVAEFDLGSSLHLEQRTLLLELRAEAPFEASEALTLTPGMDFLGGYYWFTVDLPFDPSIFGNYDPLAEREPYSLTGDGTAWGPDIFLDAEIRPLKERDSLLIKPGLRFNYVNILNQLQVTSAEPRLAVRWAPTRTGVLKLGAGLYHQPPQPFEAYRPDGSVNLDYERTWSSELGWEQSIGQAIQADATVFFKYNDQLIVSNPDFTSLDSEYFLNEGIGRVYGTELLLRHALVNRFFGWISYTLSRSERNDYPDDGGEWYLFELDQTHILVTVAGYRLPYDLEVSGRLQYVTGNPYTPYSGGVYDLDQDFYQAYATGEYNSERLPPYFAMDFRVDKLLTFKKWQLELFVDFLNAVRGTNPEFVVYNYDYTQSAYIRGLPFIPSPGFQAEFYF